MEEELYEEEEEEESEFGLCDCGEHLVEHKEYPTGERQFLPVIYLVCPKCDR